MKKNSKHSGYKKSVYYSIISYVIKHNKLPSLGISKQNRQRYIKRLKLDGILLKKGKGVWDADMDKFEQIKFIEIVNKQRNDAQDIRGHGFHYKLAIPKIHKWSKRQDFLDKKNIFYEPSRATWTGQRLIIRGYKVWLCDNSLVIYAPKGRTFLHYTASLAKINALNEFFGIITTVENKLGVCFRINGKYLWSVSKQHYAKIRDSFAHQVNDHNRKVIVSYNGREWLLFDRSFNIDELETIEPKESDLDMDNIIKPFFNDIKDYYLKTGEPIILSQIIQAVQMQTYNINSLLYKEPEKLNSKDSYFG